MKTNKTIFNWLYSIYFSVFISSFNPINEMIKLFNMFENTSREEEKEEVCARFFQIKKQESLLNC